jgi:sugar O-acyltransferase (sialic acid O-acetyltransferase NeuD family)
MKIVFLGANNPETIREISVHQRKYPELQIVGFLDNDPLKIGTDFHGYPVLGNLPSCGGVDLSEVRFVNLITRDCRTRLETSLQIADAGGQFGTFIHPDVSLDMIQIGIGAYIQERVIIQANVVIGTNCAINAGSVIAHETRIGNTVFLAPSCQLAGLVTVEDGAFIGIGATVMPRLTVGRWSVVGAGAVVTRDVQPYSVVAGNPAKVIRRFDEQEVYASGDISSDKS